MGDVVWEDLLHSVIEDCHEHGDSEHLVSKAFLAGEIDVVGQSSEADEEGDEGSEERFRVDVSSARQYCEDLVKAES